MLSDDQPGAGLQLAGPVVGLHPFVVHARNLLASGAFRQALTASREYQRDIDAREHRIHGCLIQVRYRALSELGYPEESVAVADGLLELCREHGWVLEEIQALADSAGTLFRLGRNGEAIERLGRAVWLLSRCPPRDEHYVKATLRLAYSCQNADLYEIAGDILSGLLAKLNGPLAALVRSQPLQRYFIEDYYADLLLAWGMSLEQLHRHEEAQRRYHRALALCERWVAVEGTDPVTPTMQALALAKLHRYDEAIAVAGHVMRSLQTDDQRRLLGVCHFALGVSYRGLGHFVEARRELSAADYMWGQIGSPGDRQLLEHEQVLLALATDPLPEATSQLITRALCSRAERLWQTRLHGLSSLRQATQREQEDFERDNLAAEVCQDPLTLLGNRRLFDRCLAEVGDQGQPAPLSLVLLDVDDFKQVNDEHSHPIGDRVLCDVAAVIRSQIRPGDIAIRFGGDEFALFLPTSRKVALSVAQRITRQVSLLQWDQISPGLRVTVSAGVAERGDAEDGTAFFSAADQLLYRAKRGGRNQAMA